MSIGIGRFKKQESRSINRGFNRAQIIQAAVAAPASVASLGIIGGMRKVSQISKADSISLSKAVQEGLKNSGLYEKGVRVYKIKEVSLPKLGKDFKLKSLLNGSDTSVIKSFLDSLEASKSDKKAFRALKEEVASNKLIKGMLNSKPIKELGMTDTLLDSMTSRQAVMFKTGLNAGFLPHANKIITPSKSLQTSVFHEMGHALNANGNIFLKGLQKVRPLALTLPGAILFVSLLNKRKLSDGVDPDASKAQKASYFVKKHAGLLTGLTFAPMILEEGIASLRGQGIAKKLVENKMLSKEIFKKVKLNNLGVFSSYVLAGLSAVLAAKVAIFAKDKIQEKYDNKFMQKYGFRA